MFVFYFTRVMVVSCLSFISDMQKV